MHTACLFVQGMGTENQFTVIEYGTSNQVTKGSDAMGKMAGADRLSRVSGLEKVCWFPRPWMCCRARTQRVAVRACVALQVFAVEQIESTKLDFELVNFVRCPIIEVCAFVSPFAQPLALGCP